MKSEKMVASSVDNKYTESLKGFEMKPLWVFSDRPRDKNFSGFPYE